MYSNIGNKLQGLAKVIGTIGLIFSVVFVVLLAFALLDGEDELLLISLPGVVVGLTTLVSSWPLYAFGQITNDVREMRNRCGKDE
ncbi:hypothetical protein [Dysosmobacter sp.]|uniref:hypothetical protein n=1 Tax=Dysosmobacter sp. TaxID=2591382 RepID=UPI002A8B19F8|nr:hypothetical protein [Dysosmobacter sp.]MDY3281525.1 hypothetical protein [Dysosmobacter sp.]